MQRQIRIVSLSVVRVILHALTEADLYEDVRRSFNDFDVHGFVHRKRIFKYNQQDATLHKLFISLKCSACFRRSLRPSSGAQKLYIQFLSS